jgi:xanthine dehydrogenase accessory factor
MRELEKIIAQIRVLRERATRCVLATVVDVAGSAYRMPGARMLVTESEWLAGSISGGCLESDIVARAPAVIASNESIVVTYDTTSDDDIVFGVGLGCKGVIRVLLEPVTAAQTRADFAGFAEKCLSRQQVGIVAMIIDAGGSTTRMGARQVSMADGEMESDIADAELKAAIEQSMAEFRNNLQPGLRVFATSSGTVEVFFDVILQPTPLIVFGAGHDAMPLARLAKELGWHVTVVDHRPAYATERRFPEADKVIVSGGDQLPTQVNLTADTISIVMTHNYLRDLALIKELLQSPVRYVGLLGPKRRMKELLQEAKTQGFQATPAQLQRLHAPAGLDIAAENPEEVALSIVAEMRAVIGNRVPMHLRDKRGNIHAKSSVASAMRVRKGKNGSADKVSVPSAATH